MGEAVNNLLTAIEIGRTDIVRSVLSALERSELFRLWFGHFAVLGPAWSLTLCHSSLNSLCVSVTVNVTSDPQLTLHVTHWFNSISIWTCKAVHSHCFQ